MWPVMIAAMRTYAPYIVFPFSVIIGVIGYGVEGTISDRFTPWRESVVDRRKQRQLEEESDFKIPKSIFEKNVSPSLEPPK